MIGYVTLGTNNLVRAGKFYDELLAAIGAKRTAESATYTAWSNGPDQPALYVFAPANGKEATVGNGVMIALTAKSTAQVHQVYEKAIALGAQDEGAAGPRGGGFYAGYFRDLDGNKLCVYCFGE